MITFLKRANSPLILGIHISLWILVDLVLLGRVNDLSKSDWSGWVQAVGSVGAILVAVGVAHHQSESQREREESKGRDDVSGLLRCLRSELEVALAQLVAGVGPLIEATKPDSPFDITFPVPEDPFHIYNALIPKLGTIRDDNLRNQIVRAYAAGKSFILTMRFNNDLVQKMRAAEDGYRANLKNLLGRQQMIACSEIFGRYGNQVRRSYTTLKAETDILMPMLSNV
jgi:hypothetical protein